MITYKIQKSLEGLEASVYSSEGKSIPFDPNNTDYQEYIKWTKLSPSNVAAPADEL